MKIEIVGPHENAAYNPPNLEVRVLYPKNTHSRLVSISFWW